MTGMCVISPASLKRVMRDQIRLSREWKKLKLRSPMVTRANQIQISSLVAKLKLVWEEEMHVSTQNEEMSIENLSAGLVVEARE